MKRQRGRGRKGNHNNNNHGNRSFDSNGPDVKVRGNATQVFDKYTALARDAASSGNRVKAENLRQHAEHYLRVAKEQEAAKQAAREEAEARRAKHADNQPSNDDEAKDGNENTGERRSLRRGQGAVKTKTSSQRPKRLNQIRQTRWKSSSPKQAMWLPQRTPRPKRPAAAKRPPNQHRPSPSQTRQLTRLNNFEAKQS